MSAQVHVHLAASPVAPRWERPRWERPRWAAVALGAAGAALVAAAYFLVWWRFTLYAPQYPGGLRLDVSLTGVGGDVHEIDLLNHYIGMRHLEDAAPIERSMAGYGVATIVVVSLALVLAAGRRLSALAAAPALALPLGFVADSVAWLYAFGHHLDRRAPLKIGVFTPQMFGNGRIGQFETFARPGAGFVLAVTGALFLVAAAVVRFRGSADGARRPLLPRRTP